MPDPTPTTPTETPSLTSEQMDRWNRLISYSKQKGYSGMAELDHNPALRQKVFAEYNKANPDSTVSLDMVKQVQDEIQNYKSKVLQAMSTGGAKGSEGVNPSNFMKGISQVDGIFGSKTSSWQFPQAYMVDRATGEKKNLGFANKTDLYPALNKK